MEVVGVLVPISDVFPGLTNDLRTFKSLLSGLSRTDVLFWCARLNLIISNPTTGSQKEQQQYALSTFFSPDDIARINGFVAKYSDPHSVSVFFRGQLLELIHWSCRWCKDHERDGTTFESPDIRRTFAQCALIASDVRSRRLKLDQLSLEVEPETAYLRALGPFRKGLEDSSAIHNPMHALGRGYAMFLTHFVRFYPTANQRFLEQTNLTLEEYYACLCTFMIHYLTQSVATEAKGENPSGIFDVNKFAERIPSRGKAILERYIALESQSVEELRKALWGNLADTSEEEPTAFDYRPLRERPILRAHDGRAIILDPVFYAENALYGPLFRIVRGAIGHEPNKIFAAFGYAFESYAQEILKTMYPLSTGSLVNRLSLNPMGDGDSGEVEIADACINDVTDVVLFQMKAVSLREQLILADSFESFLEHLRERYGIGAAKLAKAIGNLADGTWVSRRENFTQAKRIYPVLLTYDVLIGAPGYTRFLASEFEKGLVPDSLLSTGEMQKGSFRVAPLIVMTIDDLENLETSVDQIGLREFLNDYSISCPDRSVSLRNFMWENYRDRLHLSRSVLDQATETLRHVKQLIFEGDGIA
jgi:hypothetical protein